jgi:DNA-binding PadR family transcriptional regulator
MMPVQRIPEIHRLIAKLIAENGGEYEGTNQLCTAIPAAPDHVLRSLQKASKYGLIHCSKNGRRGRGHKSTWTLTRLGRKYVQS